MEVDEDAALVREAVALLRSGRLYGTSGAAALAAVLLHAYNPATWRFDVTDLCVLDSRLELLAWAVLRYRVAGHEPQRALAGGDAEFRPIAWSYGAGAWCAPEPFSPHDKPPRWED